MTGLLKAIGHGLLFASLVLISLYFAALYLRDDALGDALDPFAIKTYAPLLLLTPGALLLWLDDHIGGRRRRHQLVKSRMDLCAPASTVQSQILALPLDIRDPSSLCALPASCR